MPQDGTKSVPYRSFFSCDDPKGVAECKTSRKSKSVLQKTEHKVDHQKKQKNLDMSFSRNEDRKDRVSKGTTGDLHNSSSVQLMEVSRGAHKLNQVIDNWSNGLSFGSQSKDIAKDLLRGALDLQESLEMLGKLQEASQYMVKLKKKHKEKADGGKLEVAGIERTTSDRFGIERTTSDRFGYHNNKMDFQKPRHSVDGSSRDCYDELREVIRESFTRQNLLPMGSAEEKGYFDRRISYSEERTCFDRTNCYSNERAYFESTKLDLPLDFPSSSSSQSSIFHSNEFDSFDSSLPRSQEEKPKPKIPNVIAKLMGLEEIPAKTSQSTMQKEKDKQLNHMRPTFDIDLPKAKEPFRTFQKVDPQKRTLEELIETLQFQGLVSDESTNGSKHHKNHSKVFDWKKGIADDAPPIVIMKPLHPSVAFKEELQKQKHMPEDVYMKEIIRRWKMEKAVPPKKVVDGKGTLNLSEIHRKLQAEMSPLKRLSKHKGEKDIDDALKKSDDRIIKVQENLSSTKIKASAPVKTKMQKKKVMENKADKIKRTAPSTREPKQVDTAKLKDAAKLHNVNKPASTYHKRTEREQNLSKTGLQHKKITPSNSALEHRQLTTSHGSNIQKKNAKIKKEVSTLPSIVKVERKCRNEDIQSEPRCEDKHEVTVIKITLPEELPCEVESSLNLDDDKSNKSCLCYSTELIIHDKSDVKSIGDANYGISYISTENKICTMGDTTRDLLFANSSFLDQAEELFNFDTHQPMVPQTTQLCDDGVADTKLLLDCAKELLEHKSLQCTQATHPLAHFTLKRSKPVISLEQLVGEICEGIEDLRSCHKLSGETLAVDTLHMVLQEEIWCKGVVSGAWDSGWRCGFSLDEIEQVVIRIEQTVFSGIIEDFLSDFAG